MPLRAIKQQFMAFRNGIIADTLRQAGWPHKIIFGLNLPQITEIARSLTAPDYELALKLWANREVRESRLLAPFLLPVEMDKEQLTALLKDIRTREEADIFAFRYLRRRSDAAGIAREASDYNKYLAEAIDRFL